jgi:glyoxylase-like metal-dependent hydrolase (beta-lactamase superfamily II)
MEINILTTPFILNVSINCYMIKTDESFILIGTGWENNRKVNEKELADAGCHPGDLKLILLTHGDFDHCGNAAYLRKKFGAKIAMSAEDSGMVEHGDMSGIEINRTFSLK